MHVITSLSPDQMAEYDQPVGIGDLITVDTTVPVDVATLAELVRTRLRDASDEVAGTRGTTTRIPF